MIDYSDKVEYLEYYRKLQGGVGDAKYVYIPHEFIKALGLKYKDIMQITITEEKDKIIIKKAD